MKSIHYITFIDSYSGIYQSQVIDVIHYLNTSFDVNIKLYAFVSPKIWRSQKKIIQSKLADATVLPIPGTLKQWKRTRLYFKFIPNKDTCICRGPMAYAISHGFYKKHIYDGRAAVEAEINEYDVTGNKTLDKHFIEAEYKAISSMDFAIAVSQKLIYYWEDKLEVTIPNSKYSIIPCTLTSQSNTTFNYKPDNTVRIVYSGGTGKWQSFEKVVKLLQEILKNQKNIKVLFLTRSNPHIEQLKLLYPKRCSQKWVAHHEVFNEISQCDYGVLIREDKITNQVASPVKFAEYLNAGLNVLISPNIGDFSAFTQKHQCGIIVNDSIPLPLEKVSLEKKKALSALCSKHFHKESEAIHQSYQKLIDNC